jgi:hypothetical protein
VDGIKIAQALRDMLDAGEPEDIPASLSEVQRRVASGKLIPVTREILAQMAEALAKCCVLCPLIEKKTPVQTILDALEARTEEMDAKVKAEHYLKITEGSKDGSDEGPTLKQVQDRIEGKDRPREERDSAK